MAGTFDNYARALWELHVPENRVSEAAELLKDNPVLWEALKNPVICLKEKELTFGVTLRNAAEKQ